MAQPRRSIPPLDSDTLDRLALRYVERFATTEGKLVDYLRRKIRERGWDGVAADPAGVAARMVALGYIDDRAFAEAKAAALTRRGLGQGRVTAALRQARVGEDDAASVRPAVAEGAVDSAMAFARRKRIGPFAPAAADHALREKQIGAMIRAGHSFALARTIAGAEPGAVIHFDTGVTSSCCDEAEPC